MGVIALVVRRVRGAGILNAAAVLGADELSIGEGMVDGKAHGLDVRFSYEMRGHGRARELWTVVDAYRRPAGGGQLDLDVRPETARERRRVRDGLAIDVELGDPHFDQAFVVEAAPSDVVKRLLDENVRERLLAL